MKSLKNKKSSFFFLTNKWIYKTSPLLLRNKYYFMANHPENIEDNSEKDFTKNWVNSSRFLFYLQIFCVLAFVLGGCYRLYDSRYKGKPDVEVQSSSKYTPEYK